MTGGAALRAPGHLPPPPAPLDLAVIRARRGGAGDGVGASPGEGCGDVRGVWVRRRRLVHPQPLAKAIQVIRQEIETNYDTRNPRNV